MMRTRSGHKAVRYLPSVRRNLEQKLRITLLARGSDRMPESESAVKEQHRSVDDVA